MDGLRNSTANSTRLLLGRVGTILPVAMRLILSVVVCELV
jgi:hypothetical protein